MSCKLFINKLFVELFEDNYEAKKFVVHGIGSGALFFGSEVIRG